MDKAYVLWFEEITLDHVDRVGKKGVSLAEIGRAGVRVPPGFALTLDACETMMTETGIGEAIRRYLQGFEKRALENLRSAEEAGNHILQLMKGVKLPEGIRMALWDSYDRLCEMAKTSEVPVAVRSSGPVSRPGLFATYLNVRGKAELEERVLDCWASAYAPRALAMRAQQGVPVEWEPIGVLICQIVSARSAGVLFSMDPITGNRNKVVIEASWGLGESVVQASVAPDRFTLDKATLEVEERTINTKPSQVILATHGTRVEPVPAGKQDIPCLSDDEIGGLVRAAKVVEAHFDSVPQDIEWAVSDGRPFPDNLFLLQSRPVAGFEHAAKSIEKPEGKSDAEHIADLMIERLFA